MHILKIILLIVVALVGIVLLVALFIKKDFGAEREVIIAKPKQDVFNYIVYLKNQNQYSKWAKMDSNMKTTFTGTDGAVGFISAWDSEKKDVGKGEQEIKKITHGERVDYEIRFIKPFASTATSFMSTESVSPSQTKVKWAMQGRMNYPLNFMRVFMNMEESIGNDLAIGLANLKAKLE